MSKNSIQPPGKPPTQAVTAPKSTVASSLVKLEVERLGTIYVQASSPNPSAEELREIKAFVTGLVARGEIGRTWELVQIDDKRVLRRKAFA